MSRYLVFHILLFFPKIALQNVVVINLHMFLRVADVLIDLLIEELRVLDWVGESTKLKSTEGLTNLTTYEAALKAIGICGFLFMWEKCLEN